jgi:Putative mono-oxygenase ydhR
MSTKILQINFRLKASTSEYQTLCQSVAQAIASVPGLRWKIWILNDREKQAGGIYLFESEGALTDFLSGPLATQVKNHPALSDFSAKVFDVMDDVTAATRGPVRAFAAAA